MPVDWLPQLQLEGKSRLVRGGATRGPGKNYDPVLTAVAEQRAIGMEQSPPGPFQPVHLLLLLCVPPLVALSHHWQDIWEPLGYEYTHKQTTPETRCEVTARQSKHLKERFEGNRLCPVSLLRKFPSRDDLVNTL